MPISEPNICRKSLKLLYTDEEITRHINLDNDNNSQNISGESWEYALAHRFSTHMELPIGGCSKRYNTTKRKFNMLSQSTQNKLIVAADDIFDDLASNDEFFVAGHSLGGIKFNDDPVNNVNDFIIDVNTAIRGISAKNNNNSTRSKRMTPRSVNNFMGSMTDNILLFDNNECITMNYIFNPASVLVGVDGTSWGTTLKPFKRSILNDITGMIYDKLRCYYQLLQEDKSRVCKKLFTESFGQSPHAFYIIKNIPKNTGVAYDISLFDYDDILPDDIGYMKNICPTDVEILKSVTSSGYHKIILNFNNGMSRQLRFHNAESVVQHSLKAECEKPCNAPIIIK